MITYSICRVKHLLVCAIFGCALMGQGSAKGTEEAAVSLCKVLQQPEAYRGATVNLQATYRTDNFQNEYLKVPSCAGSKRLISIDKHGPSESVARFDSEMAKICKGRGSRFVCNVSADVDVVGTIKESRQYPGEFAIDLKEVKQFKFDSEEQTR